MTSRSPTRAGSAQRWGGTVTSVPNGESNHHYIELTFVSQTNSGKFLADGLGEVREALDLGARKPEQAAFDAVTKAIDTQAPSVLFFDDLAENVAGARDAGLQAVHVTAPTSIRDALTRLGVSAAATPQLQRDP